MRFVTSSARSVPGDREDAAVGDAPGRWAQAADPVERGGNAHGAAPDVGGGFYPTYSNAIHAAIVEVDRETGLVELQRIGVVHDSGTIINPTFVEGQMHGAVAMGVGAALTEQQVYDDEGHLHCSASRRT